MYGRRAKAKHRRRLITRTASAAVLLLCVGWLALWTSNRLIGEDEYYFGGIACHDVRANLEAFAMGALPKDLTKRIETHLAQCPACRQLMEEMNEQQTSTVADKSSHRFCPHCRTNHSADANCGVTCVQVRGEIYLADVRSP